MDSDEEMMGDSSQQHKSQTPSVEIASKARSAKILFRCQICTADSIYHYYGVQSCEGWRNIFGGCILMYIISIVLGCKQFFRRIIVKQKEFKCWKAQKCDIEKGWRDILKNATNSKLNQNFLANLVTEKVQSNSNTRIC
jgi:hypothetical protein